MQRYYSAFSRKGIPGPDRKLSETTIPRVAPPVPARVIIPTPLADVNERTEGVNFGYLRRPATIHRTMSLKYQAFSTIEMPGSRVSRDSCPQTMLGSSWIFPIKRAEGARLDQVQRKRRRRTGRRSCFSSFPLIARRARWLEKGSHGVLLRDLLQHSFRSVSSFHVSLSLSLSLSGLLLLPRVFHVQFLGTSWRHSLALFREE